MDDETKKEEPKKVYLCANFVCANESERENETCKECKESLKKMLKEFGFKKQKGG